MAWVMDVIDTNVTFEQEQGEEEEEEEEEEDRRRRPIVMMMMMVVMMMMMMMMLMMMLLMMLMMMLVMAMKAMLNMTFMAMMMLVGLLMEESILMMPVALMLLAVVMAVMFVDDYAGQDPFFASAIVPAPASFSSGGATGGAEVELDDEAELIPLPFAFPHYLEYHESAFVSCNGALILDPVLDEAKVSAFRSRAADSQGVEKVAVRYEGLVLKSAAIGPFDFEVWLYSDGRILYLLEEFPTTNLTALEGHMWILSTWDGGLHSGSCAGGFVRRRNRTCMGSDGLEYNDSYCVGTCMDLDPVHNWDYPTRHAWSDGYNNRCEDYHALAFCTPTGYGTRWESWWGKFADWTTQGLHAGEACCLCGGGTYAPELPPTEEKCPSVNCPANSNGTSVLHGCICNAGYAGAINASADYPYFTGTCATVACPKYSSGCLCGNDHYEQHLQDRYHFYGYLYLQHGHFHNKQIYHCHLPYGHHQHSHCNENHQRHSDQHNLHHFNFTDEDPDDRYTFNHYEHLHW
ncbi:unnamed protein product [Symbiodinium sp. KB8]|nr:unnamed protein product [Symbiodinium sp. KB8]